MSTPDLIKATINAISYRDFLRLAFDHQKENRHGFSYASFASKAGFSSRGFIIDVMKGEKRLTERSLPKVILGLGLSGALKDYFTTLVALEEESLRGSRDEAYYQQRLLRLKRQLKARVNPPKTPSSDFSQRIYSNRDLLFVFASLGTPETGASMEDILNRTGLQLETCQRVIRSLLGEKLIHESQGRYYPPTDQVTFEKLGNSLDFKAIYLESLKETRLRAEENFADPIHLYFHSIFPFKRALLPELRRKLKETLENFVHENQLDDGDCICRLNSSLLK